MPETKLCTTCGKAKGVDEFHTRTRRHDGTRVPRASCKACAAEAHQRGPTEERRRVRAILAHYADRNAPRTLDAAQITGTPNPVEPLPPILAAMIAKRKKAAAAAEKRRRKRQAERIGWMPNVSPEDRAFVAC